MKKSCFPESRIISILKQEEAGAALALCRWNTAADPARKYKTPDEVHRASRISQ